MDIANEPLYNEALELLNNINSQIQIVNDQANQMGIRPTEMRTPDGTWILSPLFHAKAMIINSLMMLKQEDKVEKVALEQSKEERKIAFMQLREEKNIALIQVKNDELKAKNKEE